MKRILAPIFLILALSGWNHADLLGGQPGPGSSGGSGGAQLPPSVAYTTSTVPFTQPQTVNSSVTVNGNFGVTGQVNQPLTVSSSSTLQGPLGVPGGINTQLTITAASATVNGDELVTGTSTLSGQVKTLAGMYFSSTTNYGAGGYV